MKKDKNTEITAPAIVETNIPSEDKMPSSAYSLMLQGKYNEAVDCLISNNELKRFINEVECDLRQNKEDATTIKDRKWYERIFHSNVKEIGTILFKQNTALSILYVMIMLLSRSSQVNTKLLVELYDYADKEASTDSNEKSAIKEGIIAILEKNKQEFQRNVVRDRALMKLLKFAQNTERENEDIKDQLVETRNRCNNIEEQLKGKIDKETLEYILNMYAKSNEVYSINEVDAKLDEMNNQKINRNIVNEEFAKWEKKYKRAIITFSIIVGLLLVGLIACFVIRI